MIDVEGAAPPVAKTLADLQSIRAFKLKLQHRGIVEHFTHRTIFRDREVANAVCRRMQDRQGNSTEVDVDEAYIEDLQDGRCLHTDTELTQDLNDARCFHLCDLTAEGLAQLTAWEKLTSQECSATRMQPPTGHLPDGWHEDDEDKTPRTMSGVMEHKERDTTKAAEAEVQSSHQWQDVLDRHNLRGWQEPNTPFADLCAFLLANEGSAVSAGMLHDWCEAGVTPAESHTDVLDEFRDQGWSNATERDLLLAFLNDCDTNSRMTTATTAAFRKFLHRTVRDAGSPDD